MIVADYVGSGGASENITSGAPTALTLGT